MSRTNIDIDDGLLARVMQRYRLPTKKAAVDYALRALAGAPMTRDEALAMEGTGWEVEVAELRDARRIEGV
jgi:Arc/MetJ family transcription regulator